MDFEVDISEKYYHRVKELQEFKKEHASSHF